MLSPQQDIRLTNTGKKSQPEWENRSFVTSTSQLSVSALSNTVGSMNQQTNYLKAKDIKIDMLYKGKSSKNLVQTPKVTIKKQMRVGKNI